MANLEVLRGVVLGRGSITPPRTVAATCGGEEPPEPVVLELGKGQSGKVFEVHQQLDVVGYMTKQQKEQDE